MVPGNILSDETAFHRTTLFLDTETREKLVLLAKHLKTSMSSVVRMAIQKFYREVFEDA